MSTPTHEILIEEACEAEDDAPMKVHYICPTCHPVLTMGTPALCGEKLLGVNTESEEVDCGKCAEIASEWTDYSRCPACIPR